MLTKDNLAAFKGALSAALRTTNRADEILSARFVEPKPGLMSTLRSPVNHLLTGRRGVGKSTTLAVLEKTAREAGDWVVFVDVETHKSRAYPDVLIEIVLDILREITPRGYDLRRLPLRRRIARLRDVLTALRDAPPEVVESSESEETRSRESGVTLIGDAARSYAKLSGSTSRSRGARSTTSRAGTHTRRKEDFLRDLAPALSAALEEGAAAKSRGSLLLVLDDFYFVAKDTQPLVLDHLHGITKRSNVWLKLGSVASRTRSYSDGDPPLGMQPPNDVQHLSLDVGLSEFLTAKQFLEDVTDGVLATTGLKIRTVMTETARERAVLIAGGAVSRDYFDLLISAADVAWEAAQRPGSRDAPFRISAEDVQAAAGRRLERKQNDLRSDAGRDAPVLEARFANIVNFARDRDTYFFLVRREDLDTEWGREITELEDLRFVHRITSTRPNTGTMRGVDTTVFMVDIPALVDKRMQRAPTEFWKPRQMDELRKGSWVYDPDWTAKARRGAARRADGSPTDDPQADVLAAADASNATGEEPSDRGLRDDAVTSDVASRLGNGAATESDSESPSA
jgi:hypothetical protein